jgi:ankyrin repeat protein
MAPLVVATTDPLAVQVTAAVRRGDVDLLRHLLADHPGLATARLGDDDVSRPLLHVATDWPGHHPRVAETIAVLVAAGAPVDGRFHGPHEETALHWAASADDVAAVDALLDAGADVDAPGAVIAGGTPLQDARAFRCWAAAARLVERGARVDLHDAATLGLTDIVAGFLAEGVTPTDVDTAFWSACHGGRLETARLLAGHGADLDVVPPWDEATPLDAAAGAGAHELVTWLHERGARTSSELRGC